jgi:hypothetical protein
MSKLLELFRLKFDKKTQTEEVVPLSIYKDQISCLYKDRGGVFIVTAQGFMYKIPCGLDELRSHVGM